MKSTFYSDDAPPAFNGRSDEYMKWKKLFGIWHSITDVAKCKQGGLLILRLDDDTQDDILDLIAIEDLKKNDAVEKILSHLDNMFKKDECFTAYETYEELQSYKRPTNMSVMEYCRGFQRRLSKVEASGTQLSESVLAFMLLKSANLSERDTQLVMATSDNIVYSDIVKQLNKIFTSSNSSQTTLCPSGVKKKDKPSGIDLEMNDSTYKINERSSNLACDRTYHDHQGKFEISNVNEYFACEVDYHQKYSSQNSDSNVYHHHGSQQTNAATKFMDSVEEDIPFLLKYSQPASTAESSSEHAGISEEHFPSSDRDKFQEDVDRTVGSDFKKNIVNECNESSEHLNRCEVQSSVLTESSSHSSAELSNLENTPTKMESKCISVSNIEARISKDTSESTQTVISFNHRSKLVKENIHVWSEQLKYISEGIYLALMMSKNFVQIRKTVKPCLGINILKFQQQTVEKDLQDPESSEKTFGGLLNDAMGKFYNIFTAQLRNIMRTEDCKSGKWSWKRRKKKLYSGGGIGSK